MALLNNVPFRPSCVVSALPQHFRWELERELAGTVAISTCGVEQLEDAVKLRGATIAVVGASEDSWEIAERLSHNADGVRVYLAHYEDKVAPKSVINGFAGVFDLRLEQRKLAETIRQEAVALNQKLRPKQTSLDYRNILEHFVAINERLNRPQLAYELMLDGFLGLTGAESGLLLRSHDSSRARFEAVASKDCEFSEPGDFSISNDLVQQMLKGDILFLPEGVPGLRCHSLVVASEFCIGVPLVAANQLLGCLIAQANEASEAIAQYGAVVGHLLSRMRDQEVRLNRSDLIAAARKRIDSTWVLVDGAGRIVYREGGALDSTFPFSRIASGRLAHALSEALDGQTGTITYKGRSVSYERLNVPEGDFTLLRVGNDASLHEALFIEAPASTIPEEMIKAHLGQSTESAHIVNAALEAGRMSFFEPSLDVKALRDFGIQFAAGEDQNSLNLSPAIALVILGIGKRVEGAVSFCQTRHGCVTGMTFEIAEDCLDRHPSFLGSDFLLEMILRFTGLRGRKARWIFGTFGGRLEWSGD